MGFAVWVCVFTWDSGDEEYVHITVFVSLCASVDMAKAPFETQRPSSNISQYIHLANDAT